MKILTFEEALNRSSNNSKRHLLLGNGFSIACKPDIFQYGKLFERADFTSFSPAVKKTFQSMATEDFEKIIKNLQDASKVLEAYNHQDQDLIENLKSDSEALKELLVNTLAASHPVNPLHLSESQYTHCKIF